MSFSNVQISTKVIKFPLNENDIFNMFKTNVYTTNCMTIYCLSVI